ncbi:hypothetical protein AYK24_04610 [Thermoplasmatales archaeon SG8-52-4]|nr:MAG: hypothetical protein AYK24_04610 [Thermoplasmatales archaeon SG8-52-4]
MKNRIYLKFFSLGIIFLFIGTTIIPNTISYTIDPSISKMIKEKPEIFSSGVYDLLIIAPSRFSRAINPLVIHKNKNGVKTILMDVEDVYDHMYWYGRDKAEKIKYFIKNAYDYWGIKYVLLIGGRKNQGPKETYWIPVRYSYLNRNYDTMREEKFLCDLYFADIYDSKGDFSSWDDNNNGVFGEWPNDEPALDKPDLYPDIAVGRLPCRNRLEVRRVVKKIINYETGKSPDSWFKKMIVVAGDTYPDKTDYIDGEVYTQQALDIMNDFKPVKLWTSDGSLKDSKDVVKELNKGCGFIWFSGHGNPKSWATHPPNSSEWISGLKIYDIRFLVNREKLPVCITGSGCFNSMFNISLLYSPRVFGLPARHCFSWALVIQKFGGSIATIGATAFSYETPDINTGYGGIEWLDLHFFEQYKKYKKDILGETWSDTIISFLQNCSIDWNDPSATGSALVCKNVEQWLLIGDPSLKIGGYA